MIRLERSYPRSAVLQGLRHELSSGLQHDRVPALGGFAVERALQVCGNRLMVHNCMNEVPVVCDGLPRQFPD